MHVGSIFRNQNAGHSIQWNCLHHECMGFSIYGPHFRPNMINLILLYNHHYWRKYWDFMLKEGINFGRFWFSLRAHCRVSLKRKESEINAQSLQGKNIVFNGSFSFSGKQIVTRKPIAISLLGSLFLLPL